MEKKLSTHSEVVASNQRLNDILALVPAKCYSDCTPDEKMWFNALSAELACNRKICRTLRAEGWK